MAYKPQAYNSVSPYLVVADAQKTLDFLKAVFGSEPLRLHRRDDGGIMHVEARIDDTIIMLGEMPGGPQANVHVYVEDVDAMFDRAVKAGGTVVQPVQEKGDGDRRGGVDDGNGTVWWLSTQVSES